MRCAVVCALLAAGCGRIGFDATSASADASADAVGAPPAFVQHTDDDVSPLLVCALTFGAPVTKGSLLVIAVDTNTTIPQATVSDADGNLYRLLGPVDNSSHRQYLAYAVANASGSLTVTTTLDVAPTGYFEVRMHEYRGNWPQDPLTEWTHAIGTANGVDAVTSPALTTTRPYELVFGLALYNGGAGAPGTGFTLRSPFGSDVTEDQVAVTPGTYTVTATSINAQRWTVTAAAFHQ